MVRNFSVGKFWHGPNPPTPPYEALLKALRQRGIPIRQMLAGERFDYRDSSIDVLWPRVTHPISQAVSNDDSVVLRIGDGGAHLLLTGDISDRTEAELLASGVPVASQVLKVAHHGAQSSSSPDFLARVKPQVAIVTAESGGLSSLPSEATLDRLRAAGARIFRTDLDGAVTVTIRGASLAVQNFASGGNLLHPN
jgi:competence protein ComEC